MSEMTVIAGRALARVSGIKHGDKYGEISLSLRATFAVAETDRLTRPEAENRSVGVMLIEVESDRAYDYRIGQEFYVDLVRIEKGPKA